VDHAMAGAPQSSQARGDQESQRSELISEEVEGYCPRVWRPTGARHNPRTFNMLRRHARTRCSRIGSVCSSCPTIRSSPASCKRSSGSTSSRRRIATRLDALQKIQKVDLQVRFVVRRRDAVDARSTVLAGQSVSLLHPVQVDDTVEREQRRPRRPQRHSGEVIPTALSRFPLGK
jgi:hypothetical protein